MNAITSGRRSRATATDSLDEPLPPRRRRRPLNRRGAALVALLTCAAGFYAGVRVEKAQLPATSGSGSSALVALSRASGSSATGSGAGAAAARARSFRSGAAGGAAGAPGFAAAAGGATFGTVTTVKGRTLYLSEASGNTVKVTLSKATRITKTQSAGRSAIRPGDTLVVQGLAGHGGTISAASVSDAGARTTGRSGSSGSSGSGSAVGSLFSAGG